MKEQREMQVAAQQRQRLIASRFKELLMDKGVRGRERGGEGEREEGER